MKATDFELYKNTPTYLPEVNLSITTNLSHREAKNARSTACPTTYVSITADTLLKLHLLLGLNTANLKLPGTYLRSHNSKQLISFSIHTFH